MPPSASVDRTRHGPCEAFPRPTNASGAFEEMLGDGDVMPVIQEARVAPRSKSREDFEALADALESLVLSLRNNGQAWSRPLIASDDDAVIASAASPCADSFDAVHNSEWVNEELERFLVHATEPPRWVARGRGSARRSTAGEWLSCPELYLFTHALDHTSPLCAGDDGQPVPLYLLPLGQLLRENLMFWMDAYRCHDSIWLDSRDLETAAHGQLSRADSALTSRGRALAAEIEGVLRKPTYYYLLRSEASSRDSDDLGCPSCGERWSVPGQSEGRGLGWFDRRCESCRLVAHSPSFFGSDGHDEDQD